MSTTATETPGLSPVLLEATTTTGTYVCGLNNGMTILFSGATYQTGSDWVTLTPLTTNPTNASGVFSTIFSAFPNGIDVRLDSIAWVANNPTGALTA